MNTVSLSNANFVDEMQSLQSPPSGYDKFFLTIITSWAERLGSVGMWFLDLSDLLCRRLQNDMLEQYFIVLSAQRQISFSLSGCCYERVHPRKCMILLFRLILASNYSLFVLRHFADCSWRACEPRKTSPPKPHVRTRYECYYLHFDPIALTDHC